MENVVIQLVLLCHLSPIWSVKLDISPDTVPLGQQSDLACISKDQSQVWKANWYRNDSLVITGTRTQQNKCGENLVSKTGGLNVNNTKVVCLSVGNVLMLSILNVSEELNNTAWTCSVDGSARSNTTILRVVKAPGVSLTVTPLEIKMGSRLDLICLYKTRSSFSLTWLKDGESAVKIYVNGSCVRQTVDQKLSIASVNCNITTGEFMLTIWEVTRDYNTTVWTCLTDNPKTLSDNKTIYLLADTVLGVPTTTEKINSSVLLKSSETNTPSWLFPSIGVGCALLLIAIVAVSVIVRCRCIRPGGIKSGKSTSVNNQQDQDEGVSKKPKYDSLVVKENEIYMSGESNEIDYGYGTIEGVTKPGNVKTEDERVQSNPQFAHLQVGNTQSLLMQENVLYDSSQFAK